MSAEEPEPILLLSTADWDNPFWTNKQHVARELAGRGHTVIYVDSLGLRRPSVGGHDLRRLWRRLRRGLRPARRAEPTLWVCSPLVLPVHGWPGVAAVNRLLLRFAVEAACRRAGVRPKIVWTYSPLTTHLLPPGPDTFVVYHAVDDIAAQPGMPQRLIGAAERDLVQRADLVFATSPLLTERHAAINPRTVFLPNVVDYDHFAGSAMQPPAADLAALPSPRIGFVGAIAAYKIDLNLLAAVARLRPSYSFVLVGQVGEGDPTTDVCALAAERNVHFVGPRPYAELPACLAAFDVALLPCPLTPYTAAMFPMKFFEYLAAGLPVVSTPLPALAHHAALMHVADGPQAFAQAIDDALAGKGATREERQAAARANTWALRTDAMLAAIAARRSTCQ